MFRKRARGMLSIATEFIATQKDGFGLTVTNIFQDIIDAVKAKPESTNKSYIKNIPEIVLLEDATFNRFGIKIKIRHSDGTFMAVMPMLLNKHHVFWKRYWHGSVSIKEQESLLHYWDKKTGSVDLKNARVGGIFSSYIHAFYINLATLILDLNLTAEEMAAVYLHEIGHLFNNYEFSNRLDSANRILTNISLSMKQGESPEKLEYLYTQYLDITGSEREKDLLVSGNKPVVIGARLARQHILFMQSKWPNEKYSETSSEVSADIFSSRFGYGRQLISALHKIHLKYGVEANIDSVRAVSMFSDMMNFIMVTSVVLCILSGAALPVTLFLSMLTGFALGLQGTNAKDMTYDTLKIRYTRVRQQYVDMLKNTDMPNDEVKQLLEQVYIVDGFIKETAEIKTITGRLVDFLIPSNNKAAKDIALQRIMEDLIHNDLYLASSEFKVVS